MRKARFSASSILSNDLSEVYVTDFVGGSKMVPDLYFG